MAQTPLSEQLPGQLTATRETVWTGGFVQELRLAAEAPMADWTATIALRGEIVDIWNAEIVARDGELYTVSGAAWQSDLAAGQSASFGFRADGDDPSFDVVSVNGVPADPAAADPDDDPDDGDTRDPDPGAPESEAPDETGGETDGQTGGETPDETGGDTGGEGGGGADPAPGGGDPATPSEPEDGATGSEDAPSVSFAVRESWQGGYTMAVSVTNETGAAIESWSITVPSEGLSVGNAWGLSVTDLGNGFTEIAGAGYGATVAPGADLDLGFTGIGAVPDLTGWGEASAEPGDETPPDPEAPQPEEPQPEEPQPEEPEEPAEPEPGEPGPETPGDETPGGPVATAFDAADYAEALELSMDFYYAQYSGDLPEDHPIEWRGDSALDDGADVGRDLTGGWYDAGDHVKFGLPMAATATVLAWGAQDHAAGYDAAGATGDIVAHLTWVTDYFQRAYDDKGTADLSDDVFYAQVGDGSIDHAYWGPPEDMQMARPAYAVTAESPGTEVTAETAAAMAATSMVLSAAGDAGRAADLLADAEQLYAFSEAYQGTYSAAIPGVSQFYNSWSGYDDELAWSASWLYEATGDTAYLDAAEAYYRPGATNWALSWDDKSMGTALHLAQLTGDERYMDDLEQHISHWETALPRTPGTETNDGLAWLDAWGSNRYAANTAFVALGYADLLEDRGETARAAQVRIFASDQIDYMLGDNPDDFSFVVGFGSDFPLNPHHRAASGTTDVNDPAPNEYILDGALVGGPAQDGSYRDVRSDYVSNEVATDYNAGFSGALAALLELDLSGA